LHYFDAAKIEKNVKYYKKFYVSCKKLTLTPPLNSKKLTSNSKKLTFASENPSKINRFGASKNRQKSYFKNTSKKAEKFGFLTNIFFSAQKPTKPQTLP